MDDYHIPVLLDQAVSSLKVNKGNIYIDATLGGGGHAQEILKRDGCVLALDIDEDALNFAGRHLASNLKKTCPDPSQKGISDGKLDAFQRKPPTSLILHKGNFSNLKEIANIYNINKVSGILFDLGVSTHQLSTPERGFSFNNNSLLDMRMDKDLKVSALDLVNGLNEGELYELFSKLGEEHNSRRIAHAVVCARKIKPLTTCDQLADICLKSRHRRGKFDKTHPATRIFQALRIAVNDELNNLRLALPQADKLLERGGRIVVISFHSLEDRIVKNYFKNNKESLKIITARPIIPDDLEINNNPKARSAKMRVAEKI